MSNILQGRVWKFGDNIDTDLIIPARFLNRSDSEYLGANCFADLKPGFADMVKPGDIVVAGTNFGCGSSREHAPVAIKAAGISCVVAQSFARIFYRNSFNMGLPILETMELHTSVKEGDSVEIDLAQGVITCGDGKFRFKAEPIPDFMRTLIKEGGLMGYMKKKVKK